MQGISYFALLFHYTNSAFYIGRTVLNYKGLDYQTEWVTRLNTHPEGVLLTL